MAQHDMREVVILNVSEGSHTTTMHTLIRSDLLVENIEQPLRATCWAARVAVDKTQCC